MLGHCQIIIKGGKIGLGWGVSSPTIGSLLEEKEDEITELVEKGGKSTDQLILIKSRPYILIVIGKQEEYLETNIYL